MPLAKRVNVRWSTIRDAKVFYRYEKPTFPKDRVTYKGIKHFVVCKGGHALITAEYERIAPFGWAYIEAMEGSNLFQIKRLVIADYLAPQVKVATLTAILRWLTETHEMNVVSCVPTGDKHEFVCDIYRDLGWRETVTMRDDRGDELHRFVYMQDSTTTR